MTTLLLWLGTLLMFAGFFGILFGALLLRIKPQDLGRMYLSTTMLGGGEMSEGFLNRVLLEWRANDNSRRRSALRLLGAGVALSLAGAAIARAAGCSA